ncbi:peptidoglycan editing factor PgeF [Sunxiuqinia indica]|uniref:peptidoglycan editing factor PgeF n=1 Tax=Sunxiuqinia indica TaxID=2692584 RepID=UPI001358AA61|nr:peptidoglycan editing factor PgeF [Sunxiuqinia indica]
MPGLVHFTSTRTGWGGDGKSRFTGDEPKVYQSFREELALGLKILPSQLVFPRQVHGSKIEVVTEPAPEGIADTDALVTNQPNLCICVQSADCVPVLLFDPVQRVIAAVHAGWRGTVAQVVSKTVHTMQLYFDSAPEDILAGIGPSIHLHAYEVGEDVIQAVRESLDNHRQLLKPSIEEGKAYFDLWGANKSLLLAAGVLDENIEIMGFCSFSHEQLFYSARRDGTDTGRMVSGLMLQK